MTGEEQEDALLLRIVDGFCSTSSQLLPHLRTGASATNVLRRTVSHPEESRPQIIVAEDEKIFVEEREGDSVVYKERTLVDTVYSLKDQVNVLQKVRHQLITRILIANTFQELELIRNNLEKEQKARRRLEDSLRRSSQPESQPL